MNAFGSPASVLAPPPRPTSPTRSKFVTVLAWCLVTVSALGCIVSLASLLMVLAGSPGTANTSLAGGFVVIGIPPLTLMAGIGLLRRWAWAYGYVLVLLGCVAMWNVARMLRGPTPQHTYTSPSGVPTTVLASHVNYPAHVVVVAVALGLLARLLTKPVRAEFRRAGPLSAATSAGAAVGISSSAAIPSTAARASAPGQPAFLDRLFGRGSSADRARGWRVGHQGRDEMYYEEWGSGGWQRIRLSGEMLTGRAHHVIYFDSPQAWLNHPEWARHRRDEIIARIKSVFGAPDYEYHGDGIAHSSPPSPSVSVAASPTPFLRRAIRPTAPASPRSGSIALSVAIVVLFGITSAMGWLVWSGFTKGETYLPVKLASQRRSVVRVEEPVFYWVSIGMYALVGAGTFGLGAWGVREGFRLRCQSIGEVRRRM